MEDNYIKCLSIKHGKQIIEWFISLGYSNEHCLEGSNVESYYGIINNIIRNAIKSEYKGKEIKLYEIESLWWW